MKGGKHMSEKVLLQILDKLTGMDGRFDHLEIRMDRIETRMDHMESHMGKIDSRMDRMEGKQDLMQTQLDETSRILKAVYDRQEVSDAKLTALSSDVDNLHGYVKKIDTKVDLNQKSMDKMLENQAAIFEMLGEHDVSIRALKKKARSS
jgi:chromosome segregation ATPase